MLVVVAVVRDALFVVLLATLAGKPGAEAVVAAVRKLPPNPEGAEETAPVPDVTAAVVWPPPTPPRRKPPPADDDGAADEVTNDELVPPLTPLAKLNPPPVPNPDDDEATAMLDGGASRGLAADDATVGPLLKLKPVRLGCC